LTNEAQSRPCLPVCGFAELELPGQGSEYLQFLLNETFFYIEITTAKNEGGDILF
jgi:hypothetical protein